MEINLPWTIEFDEYSGYDCMTSAYIIKDSKREFIIEIDTGIDGDFGENNEEVIKTKEIAQFIIDSVNKSASLGAAE